MWITALPRMKNHSVRPSGLLSRQITQATHGAKRKLWRKSTHQRKDSPPWTRFSRMFHEAWIKAATTTSERIAGLIYGIGLQGLFADRMWAHFACLTHRSPSSLLCLEVLATDPPQTIGGCAAGCSAWSRLQSDGTLATNRVEFYVRSRTS